MSHLDDDQDNLVPHTSRGQFTNLLSLPYELLQSVLASITNFEPWTYSSTPERADATITDEELKLYTRDTMPPNLTPINRYVLGLSSAHNWLVLTLSRHPYHLSRSENARISSAVTQALRRANARLERMHWAGRDSKSIPQVLEDTNAADHMEISLANVGTFSQTLSNVPMVQYHASIQPEEEAYADEISRFLSQSTSAAQTIDHKSSSPTALIVYDPAPILKLTSLDIEQLTRCQEPPKVIEQITALLVAVLVALAQCRLSLLENLEKLERDTPIPSIETYESKDFATPKMSPRPDRPRSLSGSTVAEVMPHEETLSFSTISTVYNSHSAHKEVRWAEKRESEEKEVGTSPKRPKLSEYKQVSSGRVATLMDRFEKFHI